MTTTTPPADTPGGYPSLDLRRLLNKWIANECGYIFDAYVPLYAGQQEALQAFVNVFAPRLASLSPPLRLSFDRNGKWGVGRLILEDGPWVSIMELEWTDDTLTAIGRWSQKLRRNDRGAAKKVGACLVDFIVCSTVHRQKVNESAQEPPTLRQD